MSCKITSKKNSNQHSLIVEQLAKAQALTDSESALKLLNAQYSFFTSESFINKFGDWTSEDFMDSKSNLKRVNSKTGEPIIVNENGNFYAIGKTGRKIYAPINKYAKLVIMGIEDPIDFKREMGNAITKFIFDTKGVDIFNLDLSNLKDLNIVDEAKAFFEYAKSREIERVGALANSTPKDIEDVERIYDNYIEVADTFVEDVEQFLLNSNLKLTDDFNESKSQQDLEDNSLGLDLKSSITVNNKDNVNNRIKILLSFLPSYYKNGKKRYSKYVNAQTFVPFDKVWTDLLPVLTTVSSHLDQHGQVADPFSLILPRLKAISKQKYHLRKLVKLLEEADNNTITQFSNVFSDLTAYKHMTLEIKGKEGARAMKVFNAAESAKKSNKILSEWSQIFKDKFIKEEKIGYSLNEQALKTLTDGNAKFVENYRKLKYSVINGRPKGVDITLSADIRNKVIYFLLNRLKDYGIDVSKESLMWYITDKGTKPLTNKSFYEAFDNIVKGLNFLNENLTNKSNQLIVDNNYFELFTEIGSFKETVISDLAEAEGTFNYDISEDTIKSGDVTKWKYSLMNHIAGNIEIWKNNPQELLDLLDIPFHKNSQWIKALLRDNGEGLKSLVVELTNTFQEEGKSAEGTNNVDTKLVDDVISDFYKVMGHKISNNLPSYQTPVPGDKATGIRLGIDYFLDTKFRIVNGEPTFSDEVQEIFTGYFEDEYISSVEALNDIKNFTDENTGEVDTSNLLLHYHTDGKGNVYHLLDKETGKIEGYTNLKEIYENIEGYESEYEIAMAGNAFKSYTFPSLSNPKNKTIKPGLLYSEDIKGMPILKDTRGGLSVTQRKFVKSRMNNILYESVISTTKKLQEYRLIDKELNRLNLDYRLEAKYEKDINLILADYTINSTIAQIEFQKLFSGAANKHKNIVDYFKRIPGTYIDGKSLRLGLEHNDHLAKVAVINDNYVESEYIDLIDVGDAKTNEAIRNYYKNINQADAQAYITPQRWRFLHERLGKWSDAHEEVYNKIMDPSQPTLNKDEIKLLSTKPLKGVYRSLIQGNPVYLKYSQAVLIPSMIKGTGLETIYDKMVKDKNAPIDEVVFTSGIKVGARAFNPDANAILEDNNVQLNPITIDNRFWKLQQDLPTKGVKDTKLGTQIQKNIFLQLHFKGDYNGQTGLELYQELNGLMSQLSTLGLADIVNQFGIGEDNYEIKDWSRFKDAIVEQLRDQDMPNNIVEAVQRELSPFVVPQARDKIISTIYSIIKKAAIDIETNGASMIQMSNYGLDYNSAKKQGVTFLYNINEYNATDKVKSPSRLAEPRVVNVDGRKVVKPGQVFISSGWLSKHIPNWRELGVDKVFGKINPETGKRENGMVDTRALNLVGYRIPNQGVSSNDALEVVGILPDSYEDTIVTYTGITTKTGSDFDIDKMYMMLPHLQPTYSNSNVLVSKLKETGLDEDTAERILDKYNYYSNDYSKFSRNRNPIIDLFNFINTSNDKTKFDPEVIRLIETIDEQVSNFGDIQSLDYVEYDKNNPNNSKKGIQNRILELYRDVLLNENHYESLITPLDFEFFEDNIKELNELNQVDDSGNKIQGFGDLEMFNSIRQIEIKHDYFSGKYGIGQIANHLVDHSRGQSSDLYISGYLGWGNYNKNKNITTLDKNSKGEYVSETLKEKGIPKSLQSIPIVNSISAILNAYVDIAKDPYITKGNWNTITANMGMLLIRAGVHPFKVNAFLSQPILKGIVKTKNIGEAKSTPYQDGKAAEQEMKGKTLDRLKKALQIENYNEIEIENILTAVQSNEILKIKLKDKTVKNTFSSRPYNEVKENIKKGTKRNSLFFIDQLLAFKEYENLLDLTKSLNKSVTTGKTGENGAGKNPIATMITKNELANLFYEQKIKNLNSRYSNNGLNETMLASFYNNSVGFMSKLIEDNPSMFITYTEKYRNLYNQIAAETSANREYLNDEQLGYAIENGIYADMMAGFSQFLVTNDREEYNELFHRLPLKIHKIKKDVNHPLYSNFLIQQLEYKPDKSFKFIGINNLRIKPKKYEDSITEAWRDIANKDKDLYNALAKYAYYQSGFKNNGNQIYKYIPHEFFIENDLESYLNYVATQELSNIDTVSEKIYKHNYNDTKLVPRVRRSDFEIYKGKEQNKNTYFVLSETSQRHVGFAENSFMKLYPKFMSRRIGDSEDVDLFRLAGYIPRNKFGRQVLVPLYIKTNKLGYKSKRGQFIEYGGSSEQSVYSENNLNEKESKKVDEVLKQAELNGLIDIRNVDALERIQLENITSVGEKDYSGQTVVTDSNPIVTNIIEYKPNDGVYKVELEQDGTLYTVEFNENMKPQNVSFYNTSINSNITVPTENFLLSLNDKKSLKNQMDNFNQSLNNDIQEDNNNPLDCN